MIKASSLLYAVFVCFIVALLCGGLLLVANAHQKLSVISLIDEQLLDDSESAFEYALAAMSDWEYDQENSFMAYEGASEATLIKKKWGLFDIVSCKIIRKRDTLVKSGFVGINGKEEKLALYLSDHDRPLNMVGKAKIIGDVKMSKYGMKQAYIQNRRGFTTEYHIGQKKRSGKLLPKLNTELIKETSNFNSVSLTLDELVQKLKGFNSFSNPSVVVNFQRPIRLSDISLKGNIRLVSNQKITVATNASIEDIILDAPEVVFEKGFSGSVQVLRAKKVVLEEKVRLQYPSSLYVEVNPEVQENVVEIKKGSQIIGGVIVTGDDKLLARNRVLYIDEEARIVGDIYNMGATELRGEIIGTLYTDRFVLNTLGSIYDNHMMDSEINRTKLADNFIGIPLFQNLNQMSYELIKEL